MNQSTFLTHTTSLLSRHSKAVILCSILSMTIMVIAYFEETLFHSAIYLMVMGASFLISEAVLLKRGTTQSNWEIKKPKQEFRVLIACVLIGFLIVTTRFILISDFQSFQGLPRIILLVFVLIFIYPIFLITYFFFFKKYKPRQLGVVFRNWWVAIPIIAVIGIPTYFLFPEELQFQQVVENNGYMAFITLGFLTAAIPEEFTRLLLQTRLSRVLANKDWGWFMASFVWMIMHIPLFYSQQKDVYGAITTSVGIMPIGLLWGYLTERYKSLIPSVLVHGTNLWGLQNIF